MTPKKPPSSSDFPALTNKQTTRDDFNNWYSRVISILATEDWLPLYEKPNVDVIPDGTLHPVLNNHLYSVLINKIKDKPQRLIRNLQYLWSDGVALLHELKRVYYGRLTHIEVRDLHSQLLRSTWSRSPTEDINTYAARTMQVRRYLKDHGIIIPPDQIKECFIMGLGPDFTDIQKDLQWNRLQDEWIPIDIVELIEPARKLLKITTYLWSNNQQYKLLHSTKKPLANPTTPSKPPSDTKSNHNSQAPSDNLNNNLKQHRAHQDAIPQTIQQGTFNVNDFKSQVIDNACVYHGWLHKGQPDSSKHCNIVNDLLQQAAASHHPNHQPTHTEPPTKPEPPRAKTTTGPTEQDVQHMTDALNTLSQFGDNVDNLSKKSTDSYFSCSPHCFTIQCKKHITHNLT